MNTWRKELRTMLDRMGTSRPPALRRSDRPETLYATDLPLCSDAAQCNEFCRQAAAMGWQCEEEKGWLLLSRSVQNPPEGWFGGPFGTEAGSCCSLLRRADEKKEQENPNRKRMDAFLLIKAGEEGPEAYEQACRKLHLDWAERLRKKEALPRLDPRFFGEETWPSEGSGTQDE